MKSLPLIFTSLGCLSAVAIRGTNARDSVDTITPAQAPGEEDRLLQLYAVNDATVVNVATTYGQLDVVYADITIEFETSSNIGKYEALCVVEGEDCDGAPLGDGVVVADSSKKTATKQTRQVVVTNVDVTTDDIECFVRASGPVSKKQLCVPVTPKGKPGPCTGPVQAEGTAWVFSCGPVSCQETCGTIGEPCNENGMRAVDTEAKGVYVLGLVDQFATAVFDDGFADAPVVDYYSPYFAEFYWNGADPGDLSDCGEPGLESVSQRICCCSNDLADCPTSSTGLVG